LNGKPLYIDPDLVAWIEERLSVPVGSTSEADAAMPRTTGRHRAARTDESAPPVTG
jgi:hypothetical protein